MSGSSNSGGLNVAAKPFVPSFGANANSGGASSRLNPTARAFVPSFDTAGAPSNDTTASADVSQQHPAQSAAPSASASAATTLNTAAPVFVPSPSPSSSPVAAATAATHAPLAHTQSAPPAATQSASAALLSSVSSPSAPSPSAAAPSRALLDPLLSSLPPLSAPSSRRPLTAAASAKVRKPKSLQDDDDTADRRSAHSYSARHASNSASAIGALSGMAYYGLSGGGGSDGGRSHSSHPNSEHGVSFSASGGSGPLSDGGMRQYSIELLLSLRSVPLSHQWPLELDDGCDAILGSYSNHLALNGSAQHDSGSSNTNNSKRQSGGGGHGNELFRSSEREKDSGANSSGWRDNLSATPPPVAADSVAADAATASPATASSSSSLSSASLRPSLGLRPTTSLRPGASSQSSVGRLKTNKQTSFQPHDKQGGGQQGGRGGSSSGGGQPKDGGASYNRQAKDAPLDIKVAPLEKTERRYTVVKDIPPDAKLLRALNSILNKLTPEKFDTLLDQVLGLKLTNVGLLRDVVTAIFEKALAEPTFSPTYAQFCVVLSDKLPTFADDEGEQTFRKLILNRCQAEFESESHKLSEQQQASMSQEDMEQHTAMVKRRTLGTIRFIGELYIRQLIASRIMRHCFPESDTRVLTNHGYLFLDEIEEKLRQQQTVLYACYEVKKRNEHNELVESMELKYSRGELVIPANDGQPLPEHLLEFTSPGEHARWAKESGSYGKNAILEDNPNGRHVSLRVTPDHTMFVQYGHKDNNGVIAWACATPRDSVTGKRGPASSRVLDEHVKVPASSLRSTNDRAHIRTLACAEAGYVPPSTTRRDAVMSALGLTRPQFTAFLQLFGFWLGDGSMAYHTKGSGYNGVAFRQVKQTDKDWLRRTCNDVGLSQAFIRCGTPNKGSNEHLVITHSAWFDLFDGEFGCKYRSSEFYPAPPTSTPTSASTSTPTSSICSRTRSGSAVSDSRLGLGLYSTEFDPEGETCNSSGCDSSERLCDVCMQFSRLPHCSTTVKVDDDGENEPYISSALELGADSDWSQLSEWSDDEAAVIKEIASDSDDDRSPVEPDSDDDVVEDMDDVAEGDVEKQAPPLTGFVPESIKSAKWLPDWVLAELSGDEMRQIIAGLHRANGFLADGVKSIHTSGARFKDQLMQALLHCGCSAYVNLMYPAGTIRGYKFHDQAVDCSTYTVSNFDSFSREKQRHYKPIKATIDVWTVNWAEPNSNSGKASCWPSMPRQACITTAAYSAARDKRIWCVEIEHKDHLIFAQRAHRTHGVVTKQSRPIVVGNCITLLFGDINAPVEEDIEALCRLLDTTGRFLEHSKGKDSKVNHDFLHTTLAQLAQLKERRELLSSRIRFMIADVLDVQKSGWVNRRAQEQAKKISAVHEEAAKQEREAAQQADLQRMYQSMHQHSMSGANRPSPASRMARPTDRYALPHATQHTTTPAGQWETVGGGKGAKQGAAAAVTKHSSAANRTADSDTSEEVNAYALLDRRRGGRGDEKEQEEEDEDEDEEDEEDEHEDSPPQPTGDSVSGKGVGASSTLSADDLRDRAEAVVKELCNSEDLSDALLSVEELGPANRDERFIEGALLAAMETKKESHRLLVCRVLGEACRRKLLTPAAVERGLLSVLSQVDDISIDLPKCDEYCALFIAQLAADSVVSLALLTPAVLQSISAAVGAAARFVLSVLQQMKRLTGGEEAVVAAVRRAQMDSAQPLDLPAALDKSREQAHKLLTEKKLERVAEQCLAG